jgi:hypothetical protein
VGGQRCGQGKQTWLVTDTETGVSGQEVYKGQWEADQPHGQGERLYVDGSVYSGVFWEGLRHDAQALVVYQDGRRAACHYQRDVLLSSSPCQ